jgi:hypothetical protein
MTVNFMVFGSQDCLKNWELRENQERLAVKMKIKPLVGHTYIIDGIDYKFTKGTSPGCYKCDYYDLTKEKDCVFSCNFGHMKQYYKKAIILCPYCKIELKNISYTNGLYKCHNCGQTMMK